MRLQLPKRYELWESGLFVSTDELGWLPKWMQRLHHGERLQSMHLFGWSLEFLRLWARRIRLS